MNETNTNNRGIWDKPSKQTLPNEGNLKNIQEITIQQIMNITKRC